MKREYRSWYSDRLQREMNIRVYGHTGTPLLILPTQDSMCDNFENFGMIDTVAPEIEAGKIQLFAVDTVDRETWSNVWGDKGWRAARQEDYYNYLIEEVLPFIRTENGTGRLPEVNAAMLRLQDTFDEACAACRLRRLQPRRAACGHRLPAPPGSLRRHDGAFGRLRRKVLL